MLCITKIYTFTCLKACSYKRSTEFCNLKKFPLTNSTLLLTTNREKRPRMHLKKSFTKKKSYEITADFENKERKEHSSMKISVGKKCIKL